MINQAIEDDDAVSQACEFALLSIRNKIVPPELARFAGTT